MSLRRPGTALLGCALGLLSMACKGEPQRADARQIDAPSDAVTSCNEYPDLGVRLCPSYQPYCCAFGQYQFCSADSKMGTCMEHPIGGIRQTCDRVTGDGCPVDHSICCGIDGITFCSDRKYTGLWQCSP